jgi:hypothetical protein
MPLSRPIPAPKQPPRVKAKQARRALEAAEMKACYAIVDARDGGRCRVCNKHASPHAVGLLEKMHRHHMVYRSAQGEHKPYNVVSVCSLCDALIHVEGILRVSGDASLRHEDTGRLCGVLIERLKAGAWTADGMR